GLLARLAPGDLLGSLVGIDETRDPLDLPRRAPGKKRGHPELLHQDDAVALRVVEENRRRRAAPDHIEPPLVAPAAGKQAMAEAHDIDADMAGKARLDADD